MIISNHLIFLVALIPPTILSANGGWNNAPDTQYHIQTDEGPERYFRYQTISGQYRKEKRLEDGTVIGSYGWVDANGYLRLRDYIADNQGYRILKTKNVFVGKDRAIGDAVSQAKHAPATNGVLVKPNAKVTPVYNRPIEAQVHTGYGSKLSSTYPTIRPTYADDAKFSTSYGGITPAYSRPLSTNYDTPTPSPIYTRPVDPGTSYNRPIEVYSTPSTPTFIEITPKITPLAGYSTTRPPYVQISHNSIQSNTESPLRDAAVYNPPSSTILPPSYATDNPSTIYHPSSTPSYSSSTTPSTISSDVSNNLDYDTPIYNRGQTQNKYRNAYTRQNGPTYPIDRNGNSYTGYSNNQIGNGYDAQYSLYDGVAVTNDGFRYYLPRQYHEEQNLPGNERAGSFGYIDPFGIRRVVYYNTAPGTGFQHRKNNRYVGFQATPYDPRPYR